MENLHTTTSSEPMERKLTLNNNIEEIPLLANFIDSVAEEAGIDFATAMSLNLALEEAVVNVMQYAYPAGTHGTVDICAKTDGGKLTLIIADSGTPFDPTQKEEVDISQDIESRQIGGLGIHLIREIMDNIRYEYADGKNILTMSKNI